MVILFWFLTLITIEIVMLKLKISTALVIVLISVPLFGQRKTEKKKDSIKDIQEVVVTATRSLKKLKDVPIPVQVITSDEIKKSQSKDFQSFLENEFSGINFTYDGGMPNINMMGFGGKYILFLVDGQRLAGETFDNIDYDRIDLDNIERIEIIKGASSSLYGSNAIGGVINIITKNSQSPLDITAGYLYDTSINHKINFSAGTKQKWGSFSVSSFYKMREPYIIRGTEPVIDNSGVAKYPEINVAGFTNYAINPKLQFNISPKIDLTLTPGYYYSERNRGDNDSKKIRDKYYNYTGGLKANFKLTEDKNLSISGAFDRYDKFKYYRLLKQKEKDYENLIVRSTAEYNQTLFGKHTLVAGGEVLADRLLSFRFNDSGSAEKKQAETYTLFTQQDWVLSPSFTLVTGARLDHHSLFKNFFTFRLSGMYKLDNLMTLRGGYSGGFRSPTLKELYTNWFHPWGGGFQIMGNKNLKPETSDNYTVSVDFNLNKKLNLTFMTQYSSIKNKISNKWTANNDTIRYVNFSGRSDIIGSEVSATYRPNRHFKFGTSYSYYSIGQRRITEIRPHTLTFKAEYSSHKLYIPDVLISGKYISGSTLAEKDSAGNITTYWYSPYSLWWLKLSSQLPLNFSVVAGVSNLFNYKTPTADFYSPISPGRTYYLGVRWNFNMKKKENDDTL